MRSHRTIEFIVGLIFGIGLILSGMTDPGKVVGFLDLGGAWDPSLAFVMGAAILVGAIAFALAKNRSTTLIGNEFRLPDSRNIDKSLVAGSVLFGIGWGLAGFCPGPALVAVGMGVPKAVAFFMAMLAGMALFEVVNRRWPGESAQWIT